MNVLYQKYLAERAAHPGTPASTAVWIARNALTRNAQQILLGVPDLSAVLRAWVGESKTTFRVLGHTFRVQISYDAVDDDDYSVEFIPRPEHGEAGWGRDGRQRGRYTMQGSGRDWLYLQLADDLRLSELVDSYRSYCKTSRAEAYRRAYQTQDAALSSAQLTMSSGRMFVTIERAADGVELPDEDEDTDWADEDSCSFATLADAVDELLTPYVMEHIG